jgi:rRNA maturation RNase YbeY
MPRKVRFTAHDMPFRLPKTIEVRRWITRALEHEGYIADNLQYVWCTDLHLHEVNRKFLEHDTLTDVITFDYSSDEGIVTGDIFISIERIRENAASIGIRVKDELHRVMIHGVLHLCGYHDKTPSEKSEMTEKEDYYLSLRDF